jgi:hypothetical protein
MKTAAEEEVDGVANRTADKGVEFQVRLSTAENEATSCSITVTDRIENQRKREN